ncbi:MAG: class I SAM-dependent methyltransferase [Methanothrix sp.]|nr:class I SAM-dependent methyltransferase [Methanothrix sp.]MDD4447181.1 class I SAM-dependent methyltransferase [Methanothrix sp.]
MDCHLDPEELEFWESQKRCGEEIDLKLARDLPDDTPDFILKMMGDFEEDAAEFCFSGAEGLVLDAGCGNGNLLLRALKNKKIPAKPEKRALQVIGMDFSANMLCRAALRAKGNDRTGFLQGSVTDLPFQDQSFDRVISSGVLTCLPNTGAAARALQEFYRVLKPEGVLVVDFFSRTSHYTLIRKHLFRETIKPPEYVSPSEFNRALEDAGFSVLACRGFDFKPCQGYLFLNPWRRVIDPGYFQEKLSRYLERKVLPRQPGLNLLGYRIYVKCIKK